MFVTPKGTRRYKSRKGKEATGASGAVGQDGAEQTGVLPAGTIPTTVLPALVEQVDNATGLPVGPTLPTEVNETNVDEQQEQVHGDDTGSSNVGAGSGQNVDANNVRVTGAEEVIEPTIRGLVEAMQIMGAQIASLTQAFTPLVNSSVGQANPPVRVAAGVADVGAGRVAEVIEIDPPVRPVHGMDYLKVLEHISKLGTKHFAGSVDPMEADEWRTRLVRNFKSTRCPEDYKKDIAVHFLEGDAHNWWLALDKRTNGTIEHFADFEVEFNHKYFPAEAWDRLESKFLDLTQGRRTVREYEEEFNRLRRYVGRELEDEKVQVRRFIRGLRVELRTYCSVCKFHTVSELVERMALLETNLTEEGKQKLKSVVVSSGQSGDKKRKRDSTEEGKTSSGRSECPKCGRYHGGECWKAMGACTRCGKMDHSAKDCPSPLGESRTCHHCGQKGHYRRDCPKLQGNQSKGRGEASRPVQGRGQTSTPRVYELSKDVDGTQPFQAITGNILDYYFYNSSRIAWYGT